MFEDHIQHMILVGQALEAAGIPHVLVGSMSSNVHGFARSTKDMDLVVQTDHAGLDRLFAAVSVAFDIDPQASFETITGTFRHILIAKDEKFKVEIFQLSSDAHDQERFRRRLTVDYPALKARVSILTAEDVIVTKLRWARAKDLEDIRDVIAVQGESLDWNYIHHWVTIHGTRARLDEIRASIPKID
ncbi:MAG TPA: nucleotidyltransferase [Verrucomicrobiae bacterium]|nr:nucleotidyltransferase [Verrucomicrobiae bacterium]